MEGINLLLIVLYIVCTAFMMYCLPQKKKWYAILATSLCSYYVLAGNKIIFLIILSLIIYKGGFIVQKNKKRISIIVLGMFIPLIGAKLVNTGFHFDNYISKHITNSSRINWYSIFQILGVSYFTFNGISYLIDIKKKFIKPQKNFFLLLLYLMYFPIIFSGPLHRANYLFSQFEKAKINNESISRGMRLILWGLFKNLVIAQRIFSLINLLLSKEISGGYYLILGFLFFLYLYCNFSSFIDFFQGISQLFNIQLKNNFRNRIYLSASRQEFWKGWHITLNEWFRDYFFFMMAKRDKKRRYTDIILLITFLLIALWHELSVTLLIWGTLNGVWIILEKKVDLQRLPMPKIRNILGVFYHLFFSSILAMTFISPSVFDLFHKVFIGSANISFEVLRHQSVNIMIIISSFLIMDYHFKKAKKDRFDEYLNNKYWINRWFIYTKLLFIIIIFGVSSGIENYYIMF